LKDLPTRAQHCRLPVSIWAKLPNDHIYRYFTITNLTLADDMKIKTRRTDNSKLNTPLVKTFKWT